MPDPATHPVLDGLKQRGLVPVRWNPSRRLFVPRNLTDAIRTRLLDLWHDYGFRLLVRDLLIRPEKARLSDLRRFCSADAAKRLLAELEELGLIKKVGKGSWSCVVGDSGSFGVTLEWYLAQMLHDEFASPSLWGVRIRGLGPGDFDVLATLGHRLLAIEAKSSPPKHIHEPEVRSFWKRLLALQPDLAFYFVDTHLRMKDKIVVLFEETMPDFSYHDADSFSDTRPRERVQRLHDEVFHIGHRIYLVNSHRSIEENFRRCLQHAQPVFFRKTED